MYKRQVLGTLCVSAVLFFGVYGVILLLLKEDFVSDIVKSIIKKIGESRG